MKNLVLTIIAFCCSFQIVAQTYATGKVIYSEEANIQQEGYDKRMKVGDIDNDGVDDIVLLCELKTTWFKNDGSSQLTFGGDIALYGHAAEDIALADMNKDGLIDVVIAMTDNNEIVWYPNMGNANFGGPIQVSNLAIGASTITVDDVDGDGHLDVIFGSYSESLVGWYRNEGRGVFDTTTRIISLSGRSVSKVLSSDIDNDGDIDVFFNDAIDDEVFVKRNTGNLGLFGSEMLITNIASSYFNAFDVGDANNDDFDDVMISYYNGTQHVVEVFINNSFGNYFQSQSMFTSKSPRFKYFSDVDGDGWMDIVVNESINYLLVFKNNEGVFSSVADSVAYTGSLNDLVLLDINDDEQSDFIFLDNPDIINWVENTLPIPNANIQIAYEQNVYNGNLNSKALFIDMNGDSLVDPFFIKNNANDNFEMTQLTGEIAQSFETENTLINGSNEVNNDPIHYKDINGDGLKDILTTFHSSSPSSAFDNEIRWFKNLGNNAYATTGTAIPSLSYTDIHLVELFDINGDGSIDILAIVTDTSLVDSLQKSTLVLLNDGLGDFSSSSSILPSFFCEDIDLEVGDLDGDGDEDITAVFSDPGGTFQPTAYVIVSYINEGNGIYSEGTELRIANPSGAFPYRFRLNMADINGNNRNEIFVDYNHLVPIPPGGCGHWGCISNYKYSYFIYEFDSQNGVFQAINGSGSWPRDWSPNPFKLVFDDVNEDGNIDILTFDNTIYDDEKIVWNLGDGQGNFLENEFVGNISHFHSANYKSKPYAADADNDGDIDVFLTSKFDETRHARITFYENLTSTPNIDADEDGIDRSLDCDDNNSNIGSTLNTPQILSAISICEDQELIIDISQPQLGVFYEWMGPNNYNNGGLQLNIPSIAIEDEGTYEVLSYTYYPNNCLSNLADIDVSVLLAPEVSISENQGILTANSSTANSYQWYLNDQEIDGAINNIYTTISNGNYSVEVVDENGCMSISNIINITVSSILTFNNAEISYYPNPVTSNNSLTIEFSKIINSCQYFVYDAIGSIMKSGQLNENKSIIDFGFLNSGTYFITLYNSSESVTFPVQLQNE